MIVESPCFLSRDQKRLLAERVEAYRKTNGHEVLLLEGGMRVVRDEEDPVADALRNLWNDQEA